MVAFGKIGNMEYIFSCSLILHMRKMETLKVEVVWPRLHEKIRDKWGAKTHILFSFYLIHFLWQKKVTLFSSLCTLVRDKWIKLTSKAQYQSRDGRWLGHKSAVLLTWLTLKRIYSLGINFFLLTLDLQWMIS